MKELEKLNFIIAVITRIIIHFLIILAFWHILTAYLEYKENWYAVIMAIMSSGNVFWLRDYLDWLINIKK